MQIIRKFQTEVGVSNECISYLHFTVVLLIRLRRTLLSVIGDNVVNLGLQNINNVWNLINSGTAFLKKSFLYKKLEI